MNVIFLNISLKTLLKEKVQWRFINDTLCINFFFVCSQENRKNNSSRQLNNRLKKNEVVTLGQALF